MDNGQAVTCLSALGHPSRLAALLMLIRRPDGLRATAVAEGVGAEPNAMTPHLRLLSTAGLLSSRRVGREIIYSAEPDRVRELLAFLDAELRAGPG